MSYTYTTWVAALSNMTEIPSTDQNFIDILPSVIDAAEQRMYRDLNLLSTTVRDASSALTPNSRNFTLPQALGRFVTVEGVNVVTPVGSAPASGTRNSLAPCALSFLDFLYPIETTSGESVPEMFAMVTDQAISVGPPPDAAYTVEVIGTVRPAPLSTANPTTYLTLYLPDMFIAASMVFAASYMQNYGSQADNAQMAGSWEAQYKNLMANASLEEIRKKFNETFPATIQRGPTAGGPV